MKEVIFIGFMNNSAQRFYQVNEIGVFNIEASGICFTDLHAE